MPRAKQLTVWVPDRPGMLGEVGSALGAKKANILAFTAWIEGDRGAVRMVVDKPAVAKKVLAARGWELASGQCLFRRLGPEGCPESRALALKERQCSSGRGNRRRAAVKAGSRRPEGKVVQPPARVAVGPRLRDD